MLFLTLLSHRQTKRNGFSRADRMLCPGQPHESPWQNRSLVLQVFHAFGDQTRARAQPLRSFTALRSDLPQFFRSFLDFEGNGKNIDEIFPLSYVLHRMTWMIKHLHFYAPSCVSLLNTQVFHFHRQFFLLPFSWDIHIKNSFVKCDRELMAFQLMNHRMEIELYVWRD